MPNAGSGVGAGGASGRLSGARAHTTEAHPAYRSEAVGIPHLWQLVLVGLGLVTLLSFPMARVCAPIAGAPPAAAPFGVTHERRGAEWVRCEPWLRRALAE